MFESCTQITDFIFIGNQDACCQKTVNALNIKGLVCIDEFVSESQKHLLPQGVERLEVELKDDGGDDFPQALTKVCEFFDKFVDKKERVLVHCLAGASRSCSLVIGYLCYKNSFTVDSAWDYVALRREACCPHSGFIRQLRTIFG